MSTPLHEAARANDTARIAELVAQRADVNARDDAGNTPLEVARQGGDSAVIDALETAAGQALERTATPAAGAADRDESHLLDF